VCPECGEAAVVNEEGCTGKVRPSAMPVGIVSVSLHEKLKVTEEPATQGGFFDSNTRFLTLRAVGHTGHDPVKLPFSVECTTPVLGGLHQ
jgi:hypothetical protein